MLTLPVIILLVVGLIDFMRFTATKNTLETAAHKALTRATMVAHLDDPPCSAPPCVQFQAAFDEVVARARDVRNQPLFTAGSNAVFEDSLNPEEIVILPPLPNGGGPRDFDNTPIRIRLQAHMGLLSLPWIRNMHVEGEAAGFREPRAFFSNPIALDCNGGPLISGQPITCNCPGNRVVNLNTGQCVCGMCGPHQTQNPVDCSCACDLPWVPLGTSCVCPVTTQADCYARNPPQPFQPASCDCGTCPAGLVVNQANNTCVCPELLNPNFTCPVTPVGQIQLVLNSACACVCPNNMLPMGQECGCLPTQQPQGNSCGCANTCPTGQIQDPNTCSCSCPPNTVPNPSGQCVCAQGCPFPQTQDPPPGCACNCAACTGGRIPGPNCSCDCPPGSVWNPSAMQCQCPGNCPPGAVPGQFPNCACVCPPNENCPIYENGAFIGCDCGE